MYKKVVYDEPDRTYTKKGPLLNPNMFKVLTHCQSAVYHDGMVFIEPSRILCHISSKVISYHIIVHVGLYHIGNMIYGWTHIGRARTTKPS